MIAANKVKGVRCGIAYTDAVARLMREHNDANVIAFGQDQMEYEDIEKRLGIFLNTDFLGGYHCSRINQINNIESDKPIAQSEIINPIFK
jgi:ribose 5-phosphate isomerase B